MSDGRIFQSISSPILGSDGTFFGRTWEMRDITENILKQQELERAYNNLIHKDNQLTLALEGAGEGLWTWDTKTELFTLNPEFASRYRSLYEKQSIYSFISAIHPDEREQCLNILREIVEKIPDASVEFEFRLQPNEGMWCWIMARGIVSDVDDNGFPLIVTGILLDITERKMYERHLRETNRKMLILSRITRHDTVNQLTKAFGFSALISDEIYDVHIKELLELMEQSLAVVMDIITFSKDYQELGIHGAEWQDINACIEKGRSLLIRPPIELLTDNLPMIWADPLLEKAVYNLIENSLRHGEHVTMIKVTFSGEDGDNGILMFEDNGIGVPDEHKERIFELSFGKNTGLGLFLSHEIFGLTNITIHECGQFGHGARFDIMIPPGYWKW
jgi:PAS domain S-box-containing protein